MPLSRVEPSLGELFSRLSQDLSLLVRQEAALAKTELSEKMKEAAGDIVPVVIAIMLGNAALLTLVATLVMLLAGEDAWKAALVVAVILGIGAYLLARTGITKLRKLDIKPHRVQASVRADIQVAKEAIR